MRRLFALVLLATLLAPSAWAAATLAGEVAWGRDASLEGRLVARAVEGELDLSEGAVGTVLSWSSARGYRIEVAETRAGGTSVRDDPDNASLAFGAGSLRVLACRPACTLLAWVEGRGDGAVGVEGDVDGPLLPAPGSRVADGPGLAGVAGTYRLAEAWVAPPAMTDARPFVEGRVVLYLWGAEARVEAGERTRDLWTGERPEASPAPDAPVRRVVLAEAVLVLEGARLEPAGRGALAGPALDLALAGEARSASAAGWVALDGRRVALDGGTLSLRGDLRVAARPDGTAALGGEADEVVVAGATVRSAAVETAARASPYVAGGALLLALVAWRMLVPLYSRLASGDVLQNPNRRQVYEAVRDNPGTHVAALSRATGIGRVVVQHHLRMLAAHRLVVARDMGRLSTWFPMGVAPQPEDVAADAALKDETRRRVAALVLHAGGLTQKEASERLGISARLASYHLGQLEDAGLLAREGWRPARFVPTARLRSRLHAEGAADAG